MSQQYRELLTAYCQTAGDGQFRERVIPSFVQPGDILLEGLKQGISGCSIEAGENVVLSEQGQFIGQCHGYPRFDGIGGDSGKKVTLSLLPVIELSEDGMEARINLYSDASGKSVVDISQIDAIAEASGLVFGRDDHSISQCFALLAETGQPVVGQLIARGRASLAGEDSWLRFEVEIGEIPGKILGDGSIDFRERRMFVPVKKGDLLAVKVARTLGSAGRRVTGENISAREGRDIPVKVSEDVAFNEQDGTIRATAAGVLSVVGGNAVRVSAKQQISGDIDFAVGNIRTQGSLEISGRVSPGFIVSARGDVRIHQGVHSATVNSHGNIVISGGVVGEQAEIHGQGDVEIDYIEHGELVAGGNILLRNNAYYSHLQAAGDLCGPEQARIVGGRVCLGGSLCVGRIGARMADAADIAVGVDQKRYRRYLQLLEEHGKLVGEYQAALLRFGRKGKHEESLDEQHFEILACERELNTLNLLAGSPEDSLGDGDYFFSSAEIKVAGNVAAGTTIRIGNETICVAKDIYKVRICMDPVTGGIIFTPL